MTVRRVLLAIAVVIGAASIVFAYKPFNAPNDLTDIAPSGDSHALGISSGAFQITSADFACRSPVRDAWHGKQTKLAITADSNTSVTEVTPTNDYLILTTCRSAARHRLGLSALGLLAAGALAAFVIIRRPRLGDEPAPSPA